MVADTGDDGERLTSLGTGIYKLVGTAEDTPEYVKDTDANVQAHKDAEKTASQLAIDLMCDVNAGKYEEKNTLNLIDTTDFKI